VTLRKERRSTTFWLGRDAVLRGRIGFTLRRGGWLAGGGWSRIAPAAGCAQRLFEGVAQAREGLRIAVGIERLQPRRIGAADRLWIITGRNTELIPHCG
jgi:hypothetical protein